MRRSHNSQFPVAINYRGVNYNGPSSLYHHCNAKPAVSITTFTRRLKCVIATGHVTDVLIDEALYSDVEKFKGKYAIRKTFVECDGVAIDLKMYYQAHCTSSSVTYSNFRRRVLSLWQRNALEEKALNDALGYINSDWIIFYGGGRYKSFIYEGDLYVDHIGKRFHSISSFLKTIGRHEDRFTIWDRLNAGWSIDLALEAPTLYATASEGCVYKITRRSTKQIYIGLTLHGVEARWLRHMNTAMKGGKNRLAQAIRQDGPDGFFVEILEGGHTDIEELRNREIYWIKQLDAQGDCGLNSTVGGELGGPKGRAIEYNGEKFPSISEAARILSDRIGLKEHVVRSRLILGETLPTKARQHSKHPDAGSPLFRRWLSLLQRKGSQVDVRWAESYDKFAADVSPFDPVLKIMPIDSRLPIGPGNFKWGTRQDTVEQTHGKGQVVFGRHFDSLTAIALEFDIKVSTLKYRVFIMEMSFENAVSVPLGRTSSRTAGPKSPSTA